MNIGLLVDDIIGLEILYNVIRTQNKDKTIKCVVLHESMTRLLQNSAVQLCKYRKIPIFILADDIDIKIIMNQYEIDLLFVCHWPTDIGNEVINSVTTEVIKTTPSNMNYSKHINPYSKAILDVESFKAQLVSLTHNLIIAEKEIDIKLEHTYSNVSELYRVFIINLFNDLYEYIKNNFNKLDGKVITIPLRRIEMEPRIHIENEDYSFQQILTVLRAFTGAHGDQSYIETKDGHKYNINIKIDKV